MATVGNLVVKVEALTSKFAAGLKKAQSSLMSFKAGAQSASVASQSMNAFGSSVRSVTAQLLPFTTAMGAVITLGKSLKLAGEFEQATVAMTVMLRSAQDAKMVLSDLQDFAAETPFEFTELLQASRSLVGFGFAANEVAPTLKMLGDIAAGVGQPIGEIAVVFGKARVQGRAFARDIHELTNRGIPIIQGLAKQFGVADNAVMKLVEEGKVGFPQIQSAMEAMVAKGGQFAGLMDKQSKTMLGSFSNLKDQITLYMQDAGAAIDAGLGLRERMKELTAFIKMLRESMPGAAEKDKQRAAGQLGSLSKEAAQALRLGDAEKARELQRKIGQVKTFDNDKQVRKQADDAALFFSKRIKALELAQALGVLPAKKLVETVKEAAPDMAETEKKFAAYDKFNIYNPKDSTKPIEPDQFFAGASNQKAAALQAGTVEAYRAAQSGRLDQPINRVAKFAEQQVQETKAATRAINDNNRALKSIDDKLTAVELV